METRIPFQGFYNSIHDSELDNAVEQMFSDRATGCTTNSGLEYRLHDACEWHAVHLDYAQEFAVNFAEEFKLKSLKFQELNSPREYNFTTDRIFCTIGLSDVVWLRANTPEAALRELAREKFTSRSGFMSFYDPDIDSWGDLESWDANQVGTLVEAHANEETNSRDGFDQWAEHRLMSSDFENGFLEDIIANATPNIERLWGVHDYLERRRERQKEHA